MKRRKNSKSRLNRRLLLERLSERSVLASVTGMVFEDVNLSLRQDSAEGGLDDRLVYIDGNSNGLLDAGERWQRTEAGAFEFEDLAAGNRTFRLYDGSVSQFQTTPRTFGPISDPLNVSGTEFVVRGQRAFGFGGNSALRVDLVASSVNTVSLAGTIRSIAPMDDHRALVLLDGEEASVIVNFADGEVSSVDLGLSEEESGWAVVAVNGSGAGLLLPQGSSARLRSLSFDPDVTASTTNAVFDSPAKIVVGASGEKFLVWRSTETGIVVTRWKVSDPDSLLEPSQGLEGVESILSYDDKNEVVLVKRDSGSFALLRLGEEIETIRDFAEEGFTQAAYDAHRNLVFGIDGVLGQVVALDVLGNTILARRPVSGDVTQLLLANGGDHLGFVSESEFRTMRFSIPTGARVSLPDVESAATVRFGAILKKPNQAATIGVPQLTKELNEDGFLQVGNLGDELQVSDAENDELAYLLLSQPSHGAALLTPTGSLTYVPQANYFGPDQITLVVHDGRIGSEVVTVQFDVLSVPDPVGTPLLIPNQSTLPIPQNTLGGIVIGGVHVGSPDPIGQLLIRVDDPRIQVQGNLLILAPNAPLNVEIEPVLQVGIVIQHQDDPEITSQGTIEIPVGPSVDPDFEITPDEASVDENSPGAIVTSLSVESFGELPEVTFTVDDSRFEIIDNVLKLTEETVLDHEAIGEIPVNIRASDGEYWFEHTVVVTVADVNEAPFQVNLSGRTVVELVLGDDVGSVTALDHESPSTDLTFSVDDSRFEIVDRQLKLRDDQWVVFEDEELILVRISAADPDGLSTTAEFEISVLGNARPYHNTNQPGDVDRNGSVEPIDVLLIINLLNSQGPHVLSEPVAPGDSQVDVDGDGSVTPIDVLIVINLINSGQGNGGGGLVNNGDDDDVENVENEGVGEPPPPDRQPQGEPATTSFWNPFGPQPWTDDLDEETLSLLAISASVEQASSLLFPR